MKYFFASIMIAFIYLGIDAQAEEPVKWSFEIEKVDAFEVKIIASAVIDRGWKIYGTSFSGEGPVRTQLIIEEGKSYQKQGLPVELIPSQFQYDDIFAMNVYVFTEKATICQHIKILDHSQPLRGHIDYMCCNHRKCMPPASVCFEFKVP